MLHFTKSEGPFGLKNANNNGALAVGWWVGKYISFFSKVSRLALGFIQPPVEMSTEPFSLGLKRKGCEAAQLHLSNAEVKNMWSHVSTSQCSLMLCAGTHLP
jgi:hypothetical protein